MKKTSIVAFLASQGVLVALALLILFGWLRYDHFLGLFNISTVLRYNSMFALVALGMCFVIMTGGIDLSVGGTAALGSVVAALLSPYGVIAGTLGGVGAGLSVGILSGAIIVRLRILPFITTLAAMLAAYGVALLLAKDQSVSVSYESGFTNLGQNDFFNVPIPAIIAIVAYVAGSIALNYTSAGRTVLAIGGNEDASRLMGLPVDRIKFFVYVVSGGLSGLAGVILASQFGAGQPIEGVGWELFAIASVVVYEQAGAGSVDVLLDGRGVIQAEPPGHQAPAVLPEPVPGGWVIQHRAQDRGQPRRASAAPVRVVLRAAPALRQELWRGFRGEQLPEAAHALHHERLAERHPAQRGTAHAEDHVSCRIGGPRVEHLSGQDHHPLAGPGIRLRGGLLDLGPGWAVADQHQLDRRAGPGQAAYRVTGRQHSLQLHGHHPADLRKQRHRRVQAEVGAERPGVHTRRVGHRVDRWFQQPDQGPA